MQDDDFGGQQQGQVRYTHAHAFWDAVMGYGCESSLPFAPPAVLQKGSPLEFSEVPSSVQTGRTTCARW